jgi:hypothetical protein
MNWRKVRRSDGRIEYNCEHGVGHGLHVHGCDGCCNRTDFPLKNHKHKYEILGLPHSGASDYYCNPCGKKIRRKANHD